MTQDEKTYHYIERILQNHDIQCFTYIVDQYGAQLYSLIASIVHNREDAEELTQDVFVKIYEKLGSFRKESNFSTWAYRIAYNTAISHTRKKPHEYLSIDEGLWETISEEELSQSLETQNRREEQLELLDKALTLLSENERGIIHLFYKEGKSVEEIARITDTSVSNIKVKLFRSRKKLLLQMKQLEKQN